LPDLEDQLTALAGAIEWPTTPRLRVSLPARRGGLGWGRPLAYAAAAAVLIVAVLLAYTPTRDAIAAWVNLHLTINRVQQVPTPSPRPSAALGERLGLGTRTTLNQAQARLAWQVGVPSMLGGPDEVYLQQPPTGFGPGHRSTRPGRRDLLPEDGGQ